MAQTIGSLDLNAFSDLYSDSTQYFWFEGNASASYGAGVHVTLVPDTSFISNPTGQNILMNTDGFSIRNGLLPMMTLDNDSLDFNVIDTTAGTYTNVASFGAISTIGQTNNTQSYIYLDYHSMQMKDKEGNTYFHVSDLRDSNGVCDVAENFISKVGVLTYTMSLHALSIYLVSVNNQSVAASEYTFDSNNNSITFNHALSVNSNIYVSYQTDDEKAKGYTIGVRRANTKIGSSSVAEGWDIIASGFASHAEGYTSHATGEYSHAEGNSRATNIASHAEGMVSIASGYASHAEGIITTASRTASHAEGSNTTASGSSSHSEGEHTIAEGVESHAEGYYTTASGDASHTGGAYTIAQGQYQTVIGKYNVGSGQPHALVNSDLAFIIGNGTADDARSNALTVDWNGKIQTSQMQAGTIAATSVSANSYTDVSVTFSSAMSGTPTVVCGVVSTSTAGAIGSITSAVTSTSTTGFTCRIFNAGSTARTPAVNWIALNV